MTALNPVMTCGAQIDELLVQHTRMSSQERTARALQMLEHVRLPDPARIYAAYPHQLSGGQRQRIMIAIALILRPALLIADEPTTALDVTTQAEILRLIRDLQRENGTAVLFITHDFGVVAEIADSVGGAQARRAGGVGVGAPDPHRPTASLYAHASRRRARPHRAQGTATREHGPGAAHARPHEGVSERRLVSPHPHSARRRRSGPRGPARRDAGDRRRIGLGKIDGSAHAGASHRAQRG